MSERPYVVLSAAMSVDGYLDDASDQRLVLSNQEDLERVDAERAAADAILVGANTIRRDNPRLLVRSDELRAERTAAGKPENPIKATLIGNGDLNPSAAFFTAGEQAKLVYATPRAVWELGTRLDPVATVVDAGDPIALDWVLADLWGCGVRRLLVEGGGQVHTQFLCSGLANELQLVVAPFFVGDSNAPRFVHNGQFTFTPEHPMKLAETRPVGDVVLLRYELS